MRVFPTVLLSLMFVVPAGLASDPSSDSTSDAGCIDAFDPSVHRDGAYRADPLFSDLFPTHGLFVTQDWSRLPTIPVFWAVGSDGACPLDRLPALLAMTDTVLAERALLESAAWLTAQTTDESTLGELELEAFRGFEAVGDGFRVTLDALSPQTGMRIEYVVDIARDGGATATWTALEVVPGLRTDIEGWFLHEGQQGPFDPSAGIDASALFPTHDGKEVRINWNPNVYANAADEAEDVARNGNAGVLAYDTMKRDWSFPSDDPDNFLDITLDGCACIFGGNNVNIHMPPHLQAWIAAILPGLWYPDEDGVVIDVVGHEFFHHFQYSIMNWNNGQYVIEGTARFAETAYTPEYCHVPGSLHWMDNINGFDYLVLNPNLHPQSHWYSYGLFWGHLYDTNGGIDIIRRVLEESAVSPVLPGFVDRALLSDGVDHKYMGEALADFGVRLATRDMEWDRWDGSATYDWLAHSPPTPMTNVGVSNVGGVATSQWSAFTSPYSVRIGLIGHAGASDTAAVAFAAAPEYLGRLVSTTGGTTTVSPLTGPGAAVDQASDFRAVVVARGLPNWATLSGGNVPVNPTVHVAFA